MAGGATQDQLTTQQLPAVNRLDYEQLTCAILQHTSHTLEHHQCLHADPGGDRPTVHFSLTAPGCLLAVAGSRGGQCREDHRHEDTGAVHSTDPTKDGAVGPVSPPGVAESGHRRQHPPPRCLSPFSSSPSISSALIPPCPGPTEAGLYSPATRLAKPWGQPLSLPFCLFLPR